MAFAKLFDIDTIGQVLVKIDASDEGTPEVRVYVEPPDLGVCSFALGWKDNDDGWDKAQACFDAFDEAKAAEMAGKVLDSINSNFS